MEIPLTYLAILLFGTFLGFIVGIIIGLFLPLFIIFIKTYWEARKLGYRIKNIFKIIKDFSKNGK